MGEGQVVAMAMLAWLGAAVAAPLAVPLPAMMAVLALVLRRPALLIVGVALLASALGHRADASYHPAAPARLLDHAATVLDDPRPVTASGWAATLRLPDRSRVRASGWGRAGFELSTAQAGDRLVVSGRLTPIDDTAWARSRHLVGRLQLERAERSGGPTGVRALVEVLRSRIVAGADSVPDDLRPLYLGLVVGEDRFQPPDQRARFAAAGLSHLLAVSGQNVAFVLSVVRPITERLGRRSRFVLTISVLVGFAVATRLEPSVLRATVVAALATWSTLGGHPQSGLRLLGLAVTALILVDPFLVHSIGFQLSVAASTGILLLGPVIVDRLPLPAPLAGAVGVTVSAQVAVIPIIGAVFGPMSLVSVPANLLAGWAAGLVMMWGLTVGVIAGAAAGSVGSVLQAPATASMWWLDGVARWAARVPAPVFTASSMAALVALAGAVRLASAASDPTEASLASPTSRWLLVVRRTVWAGLLVALSIATINLVPERVNGPTPLDGGGWYVPAMNGGPSVLVIAERSDDDLLAAIVEARITSIDVVVVESGSGQAAAIARATASLVPTGVLLAPPLHRLVGGTRVTAEVTLTAGETTLQIIPDGRRLLVVGNPVGPPW
jgi:competence protein ComEC